MREAVYLQIARKLMEDIREGRLKEGERLAPERKLGEELNVARNTVKQAYEELCRQGYAKTRKGSGTYVDSTGKKDSEVLLRSSFQKGIERLQGMGKSQEEIQRLIMEYAWNHLPENEKIRLAWIDCSEEFIDLTAKEIERFANVRVDYFLLDDIRGKPWTLKEHAYDLYATTINHYKEIQEMLEDPMPGGRPFLLEKVVLAVSNQTIGSIAKLQGEKPLAVVYGSEWYRYSVECFLKEFGVCSPYAYLPVGTSVRELTQNAKRYQAVILPQNPEYQNGLVREIESLCLREGVNCFAFDQIADQGSLLQLRKQAWDRWLKKADTKYGE